MVCWTNSTLPWQKAGGMEMDDQSVPIFFQDEEKPKILKLKEREAL